MTTDILIDGTQLSWQEFAARVMALREDARTETLSGYVRAPRGCMREAARLVRHLDLEDRIVVLRHATATAGPARRPRHHGLLGAIVAALGLQAFDARRPHWD